MWTIRISLDLYGDSFSPKTFLGQLPNSFIVFNSKEATDLTSNKTGTYDFGSLSILAPKKIGLPGELDDYENWYIDFIERHKGLMDRNGVTEINLFVEVFYSEGQCNWEMFSREGLKKIGRYGIAIPISFYSLTGNQIIDMLRDANYPEDRIKNFIEQGS